MLQKTPHLDQRSIKCRSTLNTRTC